MKNTSKNVISYRIRSSKLAKTVTDEFLDMGYIVAKEKIEIGIKINKVKHKI